MKMKDLVQEGRKIQEAFKNNLVGESMTRQEAERMHSYGAYCTCGGYSRTNDDNVNPHQPYCPQYKIWNEYTDAMFGITPNQWVKALEAVDKNIHPHTASDEQIKSAWEILKQKFSWLKNRIDK